jgi:hypothetical protein
MTSLIGPLIGAGASIGAGLFGSSQADKAKKAGKKAAKQQIQLGKDQQAQAETQYGTDIATQGRVLAEQNRLLAAGRSREAAQLAAAHGEIGAEFAPYTDYGRASLAAREGLYGESPEAAQGFIDRFHASPTYQLNYNSMVDEGRQAIEASRAAAGGLNSGRLLTGVSENAGDVSNRLLGQYTSNIDTGVGWGLDATGRLVDAQGRLVPLGLQSSQYATTGGTQAQGAYGQQTATLGQNRLLNAQAARGAIGQGYANKAANAAAAAAGKTAAWNTAAQGVAQAYGSSPYGNMYTYGSGGTKPPGGPTNIIPAGYT